MLCRKTGQSEKGKCFGRDGVGGRVREVTFEQTYMREDSQSHGVLEARASEDREVRTSLCSRNKKLK